MDVRTVFVAGAGQMGAGIAQVCAENGLDVFLYDVSTEALHRGLDTIRRYLCRNVEKGRMDAGAMEAALGRIRPGWCGGFRRLRRRERTQRNDEGSQHTESFQHVLHSFTPSYRTVFSLPARRFRPSGGRG